MKITRIDAGKKPAVAKKPPPEKAVVPMIGKVKPARNEHPLAERLCHVMMILYKGQSDDRISEKTALKAVSDLLWNGICESNSPEQFRRFSEIDHEVLDQAIDWLTVMIETREDLRSRLFPAHLRRAVKEVCGGYQYSFAISLALSLLEKGTERHAGIPLVVWNAAKRIIGRCTDSPRENLHATSGFQLHRHGIAREGEPERRDDRSGLCQDSALPG